MFFLLTGLKVNLMRITILMKNAVFWDVAPCGFIINRRFGGTCRLHLQGRNLRNMMLVPATRSTIGSTYREATVR
jgi:hypothetical protein